MRTFIALLFGSLLTVAAVYVHDSTASSGVGNGTNAGRSEMIVNWDVAARKWGEIKETAHTAWLKLQSINSPSSTKGA
ncbi:MAG: hypothetical protein AB7P20_27560 [Rhizobiaceae bacterium]